MCRRKRAHFIELHYILKEFVSDVDMYIDRLFGRMDTNILTRKREFIKIGVGIRLIVMIIEYLLEMKSVLRQI